jgi:hypothetical protein
MLTFLHLMPAQLGLNGEAGNLDVLQTRLRWAGIESERVIFQGTENLPNNISAVFIGSGTWAGATEALGELVKIKSELLDLSQKGVPFLALGLGWEILGQSIETADRKKIAGLGIFPSSSKRNETRASAEACGYDSENKLVVGYANHSADISLLDDAVPLVKLSAGFGNSSVSDFRSRPDEGLVSGNLMAARFNGPLLALNPHIADRFLRLIAVHLGFEYKQESKEAIKADGFALKASEELKKRLLS